MDTICAVCKIEISGNVYTFPYIPDHVYCETCGLEREELDDKVWGNIPEYATTDLYKFRSKKGLPHRCDWCLEPISNDDLAPTFFGFVMHNACYFKDFSYKPIIIKK
jgi:hypothetical protein